MPDIKRHLDIGSHVVILITFVLFGAALFFKGFGHDLLLEAGVFLVSVKLILMAYKNSIDARLLNERFDSLEATLTRMESLFESRCLDALAQKPPDARSGESVPPPRSEGRAASDESP